MTFLSSLSCFTVNHFFLISNIILFSSRISFISLKKINYCGKMHIMEILPFKYFKVYPSS